MNCIDKKKAENLFRLSAFVTYNIVVCLHGNLLWKQFLKLAIQSLAHCSVSHCMITFNTILQHHNFFICILFHNLHLFLPSTFWRAVLHLVFSINTAKIRKVHEKHVVQHKNYAFYPLFSWKRPKWQVDITNILHNFVLYDTILTEQILIVPYYII